MGSISLELPEAGEGRGVSDARIRSSLIKLRDELNGLLNAENKLEGSKLVKESVTKEKLAGGLGALTWYTPKVIATEESRTNTAFGTLTTPDEISGVVLPTNGLILIGYNATWKQSVKEAAKAAIFIGANQLKTSNIPSPTVQEATCPGSVSGGGEFTNTFVSLGTQAAGLLSSSATAEAYTGDVTTGQIVGRSGCAEVFAAAGTYNISVKYKATSGTVTVKERKLWVATLGY